MATKILQKLFKHEIDLRPPIPENVKHFDTVYRLNGGRYCSFLYARDPDEAERVCAVRGIGEKIDIAMPMSRRHHMDRPIEYMNRKEKLHHATFYGWIAASSGVLPLEDILGDEGVIHTLVHHIALPITNSFDDQFWGIETVNTKLNSLIDKVHDLYLQV